ncbi:MAG: efflux RND transporter periplasmic adaptor subunit [Candidatus Andersenbacteria bacterium]|nr:efflux RND transporter periplasmic adaptor subunit [bacterium]MDZ4225510.1 efflux RND transporter periplasmic adaptor subunit [Candidatus Andersenbacteria bacterium]
MSKRLIIIVIVIICVIILAALGIFLINKSGRPVPPRTITTALGTIIQEVTFTGNVNAVDSVNLGFEFTGAISNTLVDVGDHVTAGQLLAEMDPRSIELELAKSQADEAAGAAEAKISWQKAQADYTNTIAVNQKTIERLKQAVRDAKAAYDQKKDVWEQTVREYDDDSSTSQTAYSAVVAAETAYNLAQTTLSENIKTTEKSNDTARSAADLAYAQYQNKVQKSPTQSGLSSLQALTGLSQVKLAKSRLTAPFDGVVTARQVKTGELAVAGASVFSIATVDSLKITAQVSETDALKLAVSQPASITFDAIPGTFSIDTKVSKIAPAAVVIEGVPTYEVTLSITDPTRLKPGLTANVTVHSGRRDNVIAVPRRAIITRDDKQYVRILHDDGSITEQAITTGLDGSDGTTEVTSGINEGEKVITETLSENS